MKTVLITHPGIEDICALETKEIINKDGKIGESVVIFETERYDDLVKLAYKSQSISKILILLDKIEINGIDDLNKLKIDLDGWIDKDVDFKVKCVRIGSHKFKSKDIEEWIGGLIIDKHRLKVNLSNPKLIICAYIYKEDLYLGVDITGIDLSKRGYKIFHNPNSLKGTIGYALIRISGYKGDKIIVDPFCSDGVIIIESGLFASGFPIRFFDKERFMFKTLKPFSGVMFDKVFKELDDKFIDKKQQIIGSESLLRHINSCKKNAKISGVSKVVEFKRSDIEWLDTKFSKGEIDFIVTKIIEPGKLFDEKKVGKTYREFFYHCDFILNKKGKIVLLCRNKDIIKEKAEEFKFKINVNRVLRIGDCDHFVLEIGK